MKFATYRFLLQKNEAHHNNVYITSNGPVFKEAGNLLEHAKSKTKSESFQNWGGGKPISNIYMYKGFSFTKSMYNEANFSTFFSLKKNTGLHPLVNP